MATPRTKSKPTEREDFMLKGNLSELDWKPRSDEEISAELFKGQDPEKMIDAYEEQLGIKAKEAPKLNLRYKNVYLSPCTNDEDAQLLVDFYNNPEQYHLLNRGEYWTPRGELKIFLEYQEDMDVRRKNESTDKAQ